MDPKRTPDWLLERIALGELPEAELAEARARLEREPGGPERLAALLASNEAILEAHPPARVVPEIERRARAPRRRPTPWLLAAPALAAAGLAVALLVPPAEEVTRFKGTPRLLVHRKTPAGTEALDPGATARPGDLLRLSYVAAGDKYGVIVSVDGRGTVTVHLPADPGAGDAAPLDPQGPVPLPFAYELDDAPRFERFFLVTSPERFEVSPVVEAVRTLADEGEPRLGEDLHQTSLLITKEKP